MGLRKWQEGCDRIVLFFSALFLLRSRIPIRHCGTRSPNLEGFFSEICAYLRKLRMTLLIRRFRREKGHGVHQCKNRR